MTTPVLDIKALKSVFETGRTEARAVDGIDLELNAGEVLALVGESGCGKTATALSILGLLPKPVGRITHGSIKFDGIDLCKLSGREMGNIRGSAISMIFQEPMTSLNPVITIGQQLAEVYRRHMGLSAKEARRAGIEMLNRVKIPSAEERIDDYPHQLSGGMKQRVMIAMALACKPKVLIADEPTTALDVTIQAQILELLMELKHEFNTAILLVTHNLALVRQCADRVAVMYGGRIAEIGPTSDVLRSPFHPYTRGLLSCLPRPGGHKLATIAGSVPPADQYPAGCRFAERCDRAQDQCLQKLPPLLTESDTRKHSCWYPLMEAPASIKNEEPTTKCQTKISSQSLLVCKDLKVYYPIRQGFFKRIGGHVKAVDGISLELKRGQTLALVGESGCGKSTLAKAFVGLAAITDGAVTIKDLTCSKEKDFKNAALKKSIQMIFQDPYSSMDPRMRIRDILNEGPRSHGRSLPDEELQLLLEKVSMGISILGRYPHEFSGGQRQRISIARALAMNPEILILDEATSALDVSVQAHVLNILKENQEQHQLTYLMITHDLSVVEYCADEIAVMYLGRIVERGPARKVLSSAKHPYTQALLAAVPRLDAKEKIKVLQGDVPSPIHPPSGCPFHPRCPHATHACSQQFPAEIRLDNDHRVHCIADVVNLVKP